jgi:hypothetical protein
MDKRICKHCGCKFYSTKKYKDSEYCNVCRKYHKKCEICEKEIFVQARTCSKECAYELRKQSWRKTCGTDHNFSKHSTSRKKWEEKLFDEEGIINVWQRQNVKEKCKQTHIKNLGVENPSQSVLIKKKIRNTFVEKGLWTPIKELTEFEIYRYNVWQISMNNIKKYKNKLLTLCKKYNKEKIYKEKLAIDHKYSIFEGFKHKITPEIIGSIVNIQLLTISKNCSKNSACSITLQKLLNDYNNFINENKINKSN